MFYCGKFLCIEDTCTAHNIRVCGKLKVQDNPIWTELFFLQEETNLVMSEADKAEVRLTEVKKIMDQLTVAVASVFDKIKCDPSALKEMLGRDDSVTEDNIMQYLGAVEQKTNELLKVQLSLQVKVRFTLKKT